MGLPQPSSVLHHAAAPAVSFPKRCLDLLAPGELGLNRSNVQNGLPIQAGPFQLACKPINLNRGCEHFQIPKCYTAWTLLVMIEHQIAATHLVCLGIMGKLNDA